MDNDNKIIEVCSMCGTASCWYGEFMCSESRFAGTEEKTIKELRQQNLECSENWSEEKLISIYGDSAPFGYRE